MLFEFPNRFYKTFERRRNAKYYLTKLQLHEKIYKKKYYEGNLVIQFFLLKFSNNIFYTNTKYRQGNIDS